MAIQQKIDQILVETGTLRTGHFALSSGLHSAHYCQCAALFENATNGARCADLMVSLIPRDLRIDTVLTPAIGGILWGYELARHLGVRSIFAEREPGKPFTLRRGFGIAPEENVLLAEDVVTTGKSVIELQPLVEAAGAHVVGYAAIADRSKGAFQPGVPFFALTELRFETFDPKKCPLCKKGVPVEKPGSRISISES